MDKPAPMICETPKRTVRYLLIVDNNSNDLFYISLLLQRFKYQVCTASTAGQALEMVSVAIPAVVVSAMALPGMSGRDLFSLLRQDPRTSSVPVIFLTPSADPAVEKRCLDAGAVACLPKPIQAEDLYRAVQTTIEATPRKNMRIHTRLSVSVNGVPLDCIEGECASVLSEHGMYVRMIKPYPKNEQLTVRMNINGRDITVETTVLCCYTFGDGPFKEPGMGLKFVRMADEDQEFIRRFIREEVTRGIVPLDD